MEDTNSRVVIKSDGVTRSGEGNVFTPLLGDGSHYAGEMLYRPNLTTTYSYSSSSDVNLMSLHRVLFNILSIQTNGLPKTITTIFSCGSLVVVNTFYF